MTLAILLSSGQVPSEGRRHVTTNMAAMTSQKKYWNEALSTHFAPVENNPLDSGPVPLFQRLTDLIGIELDRVGLDSVHCQKKHTYRRPGIGK